MVLSRLFQMKDAACESVLRRRYLLNLVVPVTA